MKKYKYILCALSFILFTFTEVAYASDGREEVKNIGQLASEGDSEGQYLLGVMYYKGDGVPQNYSKALKWFEKSASNRNSKAYAALGDMYYNGEGVPKNYERAEHWYSRAVIYGETNVMIKLARIYYSGNGVRKNYSEAAKWYAKFILQDNPEIQEDIDSIARSGFIDPNYGIKDRNAEVERLLKKEIEKRKKH